MAKIPILYKYSSIHDAVKIFESKKIKISKPSNFNDPFDCSIPNIDYNFKEIEKYFFLKITSFINKMGQQNLNENKKDYNNFITEMKNDFKNSFNDDLFNELFSIKKDWNIHIDNYKILCLSKSHKSILMWSHYAKFHSGVVLGFDFNRDKPIYKKLQPVKYDKELKITKDFFNKLFRKLIDDSFTSELSGKNIINEDKFANNFVTHLFEYFFIKNNVWDYEEEHRLVINNYNDDFLDFKEDSLKEIIFGIKVTEEEREIFLNKLNITNKQIFIIEEKNRELERKQYNKTLKKTRYP